MAKYKIWTVFGCSVVLTCLVLLLLTSVFEHKQQARVYFPQVVPIRENEPDPAVWGKNFRSEYDSYIKTMNTSQLENYYDYGKYAGSEPRSKLEKNPYEKRLFAGNAYAIQYNKARGHMHSLQDMLATRRLNDKKPGTCLSCKSGDVPRVIQRMGEGRFYASRAKELVTTLDIKHPISCADCHQAGTMNLRISRPAFVRAMKARGIDVSRATRQEMRTYVCAQCHAEYYFKEKGNKLTFPWDNGLTVDDIEAYYKKADYTDWIHKETGAPMLKMQHPEFELWSTGMHARAGVSCADCHMPYTRDGSVKLTDHWIRSPLAHIDQSCLTCHRASEKEMRNRVFLIQDRTHYLLGKSEKAIIAAIDALKHARQAGVTDADLKKAREMHRKAQMRWDFIASENSMGFHSGQEAARVLADSIDFARQAELEAFKAADKRRTVASAAGGQPAK